MIDRQEIINQLRESSDVKNTMIIACAEDIEKAAVMMVAVAQNGKMILWCGTAAALQMHSIWRQNSWADCVVMTVQRLNLSLSLQIRLYYSLDQ